MCFRGDNLHIIDTNKLRSVGTFPLMPMQVAWPQLSNWANGDSVQ